ncbi:MAG: hypothetical protein CO096_01265 [Armatimonadetes bacterium CG_4_9_14_3_um_filter_66_14]|nr:MAG: hypothetical protein CO096_01265 [Armatimonadetes bacterium CG_4_9_14_3_um_filter_66_14]
MLAGPCFAPTEERGPGGSGQAARTRVRGGGWPTCGSPLSGRTPAAGRRGRSTGRPPTGAGRWERASARKRRRACGDRHSASRSPSGPPTTRRRLCR